MQRLFATKNIQMLASVTLFILCLWLITQIGNTIFPILTTFLQRIAPLVIGLVIAFILNPFVEILGEKYFKGNQTISTILTLLVLIALIIFVVFPVMKDFILNFSTIVSSLIVATGSFLDTIDSISNIDNNLRLQIISYVSQYGNTLAALLVDSLNNIISGSIQSFLTTIVTIFALLEYNQIKTKSINLLAKRNKHIIMEYIEGLEKQLYQYLKSLLSSFIISALVFGVVLHLLKINNAWSFTIILNLLIVLIPIIGPAIATVLLAIITVPVSIPAMIFGFFGLLIFMQIFINIISPRIYAHTLDLSNLLIISSFMIGSAILGVLGALFAIPALIVCVYTHEFLQSHKTVDVVEDVS